MVILVGGSQQASRPPAPTANNRQKGGKIIERMRHDPRTKSPKRHWINATRCWIILWSHSDRGLQSSLICRKKGSTGSLPGEAARLRISDGVAPKVLRKWREKWAVSAKPQRSPISVMLLPV